MCPELNMLTLSNVSAVFPPGRGSFDIELSLQLLHAALSAAVPEPDSSPHWVLDCSPFPLLYVLAQLLNQCLRFVRWMFSCFLIKIYDPYLKGFPFKRILHKFVSDVGSSHQRALLTGGQWKLRSCWCWCWPPWGRWWVLKWQRPPAAGPELCSGSTTRWRNWIGRFAFTWSLCGGNTLKLRFPHRCWLCVICLSRWEPIRIKGPIWCKIHRTNVF